MQVDVVIENRYTRTPDGAVWTPALFGYSFWTRYLDVFSSVRVIARVGEARSVPEDWKRADGEGVSFAALPTYQGALQYVRRLPAVRRAIREASKESEALIFRVPSHASYHLFQGLEPGRPFGVEAVGDPYEVLAPRAFRHPLRPLLRMLSPRRMRRQCAAASAVAYVSAQALQPNYPADAEAYVTEYSSIELSDDAIASTPRVYTDGDRFTLVTVGSLEQMYKGVDTLIDALDLCVSEYGLDLSLRVIGDGKHRAELAQRAAQRSLADRVEFVGRLPGGDAVRHELDRADLFVLASRTEGLPRSMIEAMARALPCVGTRAGGIVELLDREYTVPVDATAELAQCIAGVLKDPQRMSEMSSRNLERSKQYREAVLTERRRQFYQHVVERTGEWMSESQRSVPSTIHS